MAKAGHIIKPLSKRHDRASFHCGDPTLDDWFCNRAGQDERRNLARVFVAAEANGAVVGFYSLSSLGLEIADLPEAIAKKLPRYDLVPAALIGRLAVGLPSQRKGLGGLLLADAIRRVLSVAPSLAIYAIVVDAKNDAAATFYEVFGFTRFVSRRRLFLPAASAAAALSKVDH